MTQPDQAEARVASTQRGTPGLFGRDATYMLVWSVQLVIAAMATPVLTRLMSTEEFGVLASANAIMQVSYILASAGLSTAAQRRFASGESAQARRLLTVTMISSILVCGAVALTLPAWSDSLGLQSHMLVLRMCLAWAATSAVTNCCLALLRSQDRLLPFAVVSAVQSLVAEGLSLSLVALLGGTAGSFVGGQLAAQILAMCLSLLAVKASVFRRRHLKAIGADLRFALPLVPAALSTFILAMADRLILQRKLGSADVGRYQIAYNIGSLPTLLVGVLNTAWLPRFFSSSPDQVEMSRYARDQLDRLLLPVVVGMSVGSPLLLALWAPSSYAPQDLLAVTAVVVVSVLPYAAGLVPTRTLLTSGKSLPVALATALAAVANVALNFLLIPSLGIAGAGLATLLAYVILWLALAVAARAVVAVPARGWRPATLMIIAGAIALVSAGVGIDGAWLGLRLLVTSAAVVWFVLEGLLASQVSLGTLWRKLRRPSIEEENG
ncbi:MAG: polysaccharide biosynthesis protein [Frondihabitans sp.]|nr:polysaccharide biosynthesis protein [Frondihabitans sp.]